MLETLDDTVLRALSMQPENRFGTAREMALEIERKSPPATGSEVADWVESVARDVLSSRAQMVAEIESSASLQPMAGQDHVQAVLNAKATLGPGVRLTSDPPSMNHGSITPAPPSHPTAMEPQYSPRSSKNNFPNATLPLPPASYPVEGPPVTQPSSISVSTASGYGRDPSTGRKTFVAALVGVMLGASVLASALVWRSQQKKPVETGAAEPASAQPIPTPSPSPSPSLSAPIVLGTSEVPDTKVEADAGHPKVPTTPTRVTVKQVPTKNTATATAEPPPPKPQDDCSTPFWYDAQGVKRYKAHCLNK